MKKIRDYFVNRKKPQMLITFGVPSWRIESRPKYIDGKKLSNILLYADNKLVFEGKYKELIDKITK